jgi:hypothetical protein
MPGDYVELEEAKQFRNTAIRTFHLHSRPHVVAGASGGQQWSCAGHTGNARRVVQQRHPAHMRELHAEPTYVEVQCVEILLLVVVRKQLQDGHGRFGWWDEWELELRFDVDPTTTAASSLVHSSKYSGTDKYDYFLNRKRVLFFVQTWHQLL